MNLFLDAIAWLFSPERLEGANALPIRIGEHLYYTFISLLVSAVIAIPLGYYIGHTGRGREVAVALSGAARALPSLGLLTVMALLLGPARADVAAIIVFVVLGVPSVLAGAYAGVQSVDPKTVDAARAMGMTEWQILVKVEIPIGLPLLIGGLRSAALQSVATATLAAYVGLGGLGIYIFTAIPLRQYDVMLGAALVIVTLALLLDALFAVLERVATPRGVLAAKHRNISARPKRARETVEPSRA